MTSEVVCNCGIIFDDENGVKWHGTTEGHLWTKLKMETNNYYVFISDSAKTKIPDNLRCDICGGPARLKRLTVKGKRVPDWYIVNKNKMIVRCRKCRKVKLNALKSQFRDLLKILPSC